MALNTALRRSEIFNLKWNDVDFKKDYIYVGKTKTGVPRKIPMNDLVIKVLRSRKRENEFVFFNPKTGKTYTTIAKVFKTACKDAKINDLRFHDLRHTAATYMVMGGVDLVTVSEILGHSDIKMTMRYAHPTPENRRKAAAAFGQKVDTIRSYREDELDHKKDLIPSLSNN